MLTEFFNLFYFFYVGISSGDKNVSITMPYSYTLFHKDEHCPRSGFLEIDSEMEICRHGMLSESAPTGE